MPMKPAKPCKYPGCPHLTHADYCEEHRLLARKRYEKYERDPETNKRYGRAWKKIRARYVAAHPLCEMSGRRKAHVNRDCPSHQRTE